MALNKAIAHIQALLPRREDEIILGMTFCGIAARITDSGVFDKKLESSMLYTRMV